MLNFLCRKLRAYVDLNIDDALLIERISERRQTIEAHSDIIREGDIASESLLITSGLACRYKLLDSGQRQIVAFLIPGDISDMNVVDPQYMDHTIATISRVQIARISRAQISDLLHNQAISRALSLSKLVDEAVLREWVTNIGQRTADRRLAHLFCETYLRMRTVGLTVGLQFDLPITQAELGDTLGLSTVHMNRSLQALKADNLVTLKEKQVRITDFARLKIFGGFRDNYLHLRTKDPVDMAA